MVDRIYEELAEEFGKDAVFRDIDTIPAGVDFPTYIQQSLRSCAVALICMGRDWATCPDSRGTPRILDPDDHVRLEIETALGLPLVRVIPLLVLHGTMPHADEVPETLRPLRRRNAITVRSTGADYRHDVQHLVRELRRAITDVEATRRAEAEKERAEREAHRRAKEEKPRTEGLEKAEREQPTSPTSADPVVSKPSPSKEADLSTILLGIGQLIGSFFLLWLLVKGISLLPQAWNSIKKPLGITTPPPFSPSPSLVNFPTPIPGSSPPFDRWNFGTPKTTPRFLSPLMEQALRAPATPPPPTPAPISPAPGVLTPSDKWPLGTPRSNRFLEETLRALRTPQPAATPLLEAPLSVKASLQQIETGKRDYMLACVACHQPTGVGLAGAFPPLTKSPYVNGSVERFAAMIIHGSIPPFTIEGKKYVVACPSQGAVLDDTKIASIMTFVRASFENSGDLVIPEMVAAARKKFAERKTPWPQVELDEWK